MSGLALLLWKHKEKILMVIALLAIIWFISHQIQAYGDRRFEAGRKEADAAWIDKWNEGVRIHNKQVSQLEADSKAAVEANKEEAAEREARLNKIIAGLKKKNPTTNQWNPGKDAKCTPGTVSGSSGTGKSDGESKLLYDPVGGLLTVPLGSTFVDTWNKITTDAFAPPENPFELTGPPATAAGGNAGTGELSATEETK